MRARQAGFTLTEALVVVGIIAIIAAIGGVQLTNTLGKSDLQGTVSEVRTFLEAAKSTMVRQNTSVTVRYLVVGGKPALQLVDVGGAAVRTLTLPAYVRAAVNPGATQPSAWPTPTPGPLFTCDTQGRTLGPGGQQVAAVQTIALTHRGMLGDATFADITPRMRFDVQVYPLWTVDVARRMY
jgi:prepilin-type N-terminal cleavage/methylation domain-containing protein